MSQLRPDRPTVGAPDARAAFRERLESLLPLLGLGAGLATPVVLAWSWVVGVGAPPPAAMAGGLLLAILGRCLGILVGAGQVGFDELAWIGLLVGIGLPVAFLHFGVASPQLVLAVAATVLAVWWQIGQAAARVLGGLDPAAARPRRGSDLAAETHAAVFGAIALAAAVALAAPAILPPPHPGSGHADAVAIALQCACACILVAQNHRRGLLLRAAAEGAAVLPGLGAAAGGRAAAIAAAALAVALLLPTVPPLFRPSNLNLAAIAFHHLLVRQAPGAAQGGGPAGTAAPPARAGAGSGGGGGGNLAVGGLVELASIVIGAFILIALVRLLILWLRRRPGPGRSRPSVGGLLAELWYLLVNLWAALFSGFGLLALWRMLSGGRRPGAAPGAAGAGAGARAAPAGWLRSGDARARIRASYRHLLAGAGQRGHRRPSWFTPRAFRRQLAPALPADHPGLDRLTRLYEEARYSTHPVPAEAAGDAEAAAQAVVAELRGSGRPLPPA